MHHAGEHLGDHANARVWQQHAHTCTCRSSLEGRTAKVSFLGTTVHPRRTPVKPAYLEKEQVSMATSSAPAVAWAWGEGAAEQALRARP